MDAEYCFRKIGGECLIIFFNRFFCLPNDLSGACLKNTFFKRALRKNAFNLFKQQFRSCVNKLKAFLLSMGILKRKQFPCPCHIISGLSLKNRSEIFRPYNFKKSRESRLGKGFRFHDQIHRKCLKRNKIQKSGLVGCVFFSKS